MSQHTWLSTHRWPPYSQFCSNCSEIGLRKYEYVSKDHPDLFYNGPSRNQTGDLYFRIRGNHQSSPRRPHYNLWVYFFSLELDDTVADSRNTTSKAWLHQPPNYPPKLGCHGLALQGTLRPSLRKMYLKRAKN